MYYLLAKLVPYATDSDSAVQVYELESLKQTYELEGMVTSVARYEFEGMVTSVVLEMVFIDTMLCH